MTKTNEELTQETASCQYAVTTYRTWAGVESIRKQWEALQSHPNTDYAHYEVTVNNNPGVIGPYVLAVTAGGKIVALLAGRLERTRLTHKIGYKVLWRQPVTAIVIMQGGLLGRDDPKTAQVLTQELSRALAAQVAETVTFAPFPLESPLLEGLCAEVPRLLQRPQTEPARHYSAVLPATLDLFLERVGSKHRSALRRYSRKLEKWANGKCDFVRMRSVPDVPKLCRDLEAIASRTYQRRLGVGFRHTPLWERRLLLANRSGWLRVVVLYVHDEPRAFWLFFVYQGTAHSIVTGYDPDLKVYSVGTLLLLESIAMLSEDGVSELDFGLGEAEYKMRFSDRSWSEASFQFWAPSAKGLLTNLVGALLVWGERSARSIVGKFGATGWLKRTWRRLS